MTERKNRKHKFAKRPKRTKRALTTLVSNLFAHLPQHVLVAQITPEQRKGWKMLAAISTQPKDVPSTGKIILATRMLGPFRDLPFWLQRDIVRMGVTLPHTRYGRIPLGEALTWEKQRSNREMAQGLAVCTFYDSLLAYSRKRYGWQNGENYAHSTVVWILTYADRDLRRSGYALSDRRKVHRVKKADPSKPNRFRKFSTRSLTHYWRWLLSRLNTEAKHQANQPENQVVLAYDDERPADYDSANRHASPKPTG